MKMQKKSKVKVNDCGVLVTKKGKIRQPSIAVAHEANKLDVILQAVEYVEKQPEPAPKRSLDGFKPAYHGQTYCKCKTPETDASVERTMKMRDELLDKQITEKVSQFANSHFYELIEFARCDDYFPTGGCFDAFKCCCFDPLDLTAECILEILYKAEKLGVLGMDFDGDVRVM